MSSNNNSSVSSETSKASAVGGESVAAHVVTGADTTTTTTTTTNDVTDTLQPVSSNSSHERNSLQAAIAALQQEEASDATAEDAEFSYASLQLSTTMETVAASSVVAADVSAPATTSESAATAPADATTAATAEVSADHVSAIYPEPQLSSWRTADGHEIVWQSLEAMAEQDAAKAAEAKPVKKRQPRRRHAKPSTTTTTTTDSGFQPQLSSTMPSQSHSATDMAPAAAAANAGASASQDADNISAAVTATKANTEGSEVHVAANEPAAAAVAAGSHVQLSPVEQILAQLQEEVSELPLCFAAEHATVIAMSDDEQHEVATAIRTKREAKSAATSVTTTQSAAELPDSSAVTAITAAIHSTANSSAAQAAATALAEAFAAAEEVAAAQQETGSAPDTAISAPEISAEDMNAYSQMQLKEGDKCPACGEGTLVLRHSEHADFLGCSCFPRCKLRIFVARSHAVDVLKLLSTTCPQCGQPLAVKKGRYGIFIGCSNYPDCTYIHKDTAPQEQPIACPVCHKGQLEARRARSGRTFYGCNSFPHCNFVLPGKPVLSPCPECGFPVRFQKKVKAGVALVCGNSLCASRKRRKQELLKPESALH